jgi:hypothetical protein
MMDLEQIKAANENPAEFHKMRDESSARNAEYNRDHGNYWPGKYASGSVSRYGNPAAAYKPAHGGYPNAGAEQEIIPTEGDTETDKTPRDSMGARLDGFADEFAAPANPVPGSEWTPQPDPTTYVKAATIGDQLKRKPGLEFDAVKLADAMMLHITELQKGYAQLVSALSIYRNEPDNAYWFNHLSRLVQELSTSDVNVAVAFDIEKRV